MDAESLRREVESPWCPKCKCPSEDCEVSDNHYGVWHEGIWNRAPDARVPGLECKAWMDSDFLVWKLDGQRIATDAATLLIIAREATLLAEAIGGMTYPHDSNARLDLCLALASDTPLAKVRALVSLHHRLLDQREANDAQVP